MQDPNALFPARLVVDLDAIAENWRRLARQGNGIECGAVVKANAYGLGMTEVAPVLASAGCQSFFVAFQEEAVALRQVLGSGPRIYVMCASHWDAPDAYRAHQLMPVISSDEHFESWSAAGVLQHVRFLCQVDTGMHRLGLPASQAADILRQPTCLGLMSHLVMADDADSPLNAVQRDRFREAAALFPKQNNGILSLANSHGIFLGTDWHFSMLRPGVALYGGNPTPGHPNPMTPVVTLEAPILQLRTVPAGESVGYGATFTCERDTPIATVAVGYADGLQRALSNTGRAMIGGYPASYAGRVSMDLITLDVSTVPDEVLAQRPLVQLLGPDIGVDNLAEAAGTISYELLTQLGSRLPRVYVGGA